VSSWQWCSCAVIGRAARPVADAALAFLVAPLCAVCREPIERPTRGAVCPSCWSSIESFVPPCCATCGDALPSWRTFSVTDGRCPRCRRRPPPIALAAAIGPYRGALERIVQAFKYDGRTSLGRPLADRLRASGARVFAGADAVVPVPLHRSRERQRGFNQARELARHLGLPTLDALTRSRATRLQADLSAARRQANVRGAFAVRHGIDVRGLTLVVVDDVSTTGATLAACARPLLAAGAAEIRAATAAKTNRCQ
jgi:ComF family protein